MQPKVEILFRSFTLMLKIYKEFAEKTVIIKLNSLFIISLWLRTSKPNTSKKLIEKLKIKILDTHLQGLENFSKLLYLF